MDSPLSDYNAPPRDSDDESSPRPSKDIRNTLGKTNLPAAAEMEGGDKVTTRARSSTRARGVQGGSVVSSSSSEPGNGKKRQKKRRRSLKDDEEEEEPDTMPSSWESQTSSTIGRQHDPLSAKRRVKTLFGGKGTVKPHIHGSSQDKPAVSPAKSDKFVVHSDVDSTPESTPHKLKRASKFDSPDEEPKFRRISMPRSSSPVKKSSPLKRVHATRETSDSDDDLPATFLTRDDREIKAIVERKKRQKQGDGSPVAEFKAYDCPDSSPRTGASSMGLTQMEREMRDHEASPPLPDHLAACPLCREPVDKAHLADFSRGEERLTVAAQTRFCQAHRTRSARLAWAARGYPTLDWPGLGARMAAHDAHLATLLTPAPPGSHYYAQARRACRAASRGRLTAKAFIHAGGSLTPGYYGPRGLRRMSEHIMDAFAPRVHALGARDELIFALGVPLYVAMVLVPELAVRLIRDDLGVGLAEARAVLRESVDVGDLLQEEPDEVVVLPEAGQGSDHGEAADAGSSDGRAD